MNKRNYVWYQVLVSTLLYLCAAVLGIAFYSTDAYASGIKVVPSATKIEPGGTFYVDIEVQDIPQEGLGAIQFRLNIKAQDDRVVGTHDISQGGQDAVSVATPLIIGPSVANRSGMGEFFWNARGDHGLLVMDNENLSGGSALYTLGHTNGASPPSGSGPVARFYIAAGKDLQADKIEISLSEVMLLDGGTVYPLESNIGATVELRCSAEVPDLLGLSVSAAETLLADRGLGLGEVYELENHSKSLPLGKVLEQSYQAGASVACDTEVKIALNAAPAEVSGLGYEDKVSDESGKLVVHWTKSSSQDAAGYRVYTGLDASIPVFEIGTPDITVAEVSGMPNGIPSTLKITAFDLYGNESGGALVSVVPVDDVAPRVVISGVESGHYYPSDVLPSINVEDSSETSVQLSLNGAPYDGSAISGEGAYILTVTATDSASNSTVKETGFEIDKTSPGIEVSGVESGRYYNTGVAADIRIADANLSGAVHLLDGQSYSAGTPVVSEGRHELSVSAEDKAGNMAASLYVFYIDTTKPISSISVGEPRYENQSSLFVRGDTLFTVSGSDPGVYPSGVQGIEFRLGEETWSAFDSAFSLSGREDGSLTIHHRALDVAGNIEDYQATEVTLDNTPPETEAVFGGAPYIDAGGQRYLATDSSVLLSAADMLSGVSLTEYRADGGEWKAYAPFSLSAEGVHSISYRSVDNLGNVEEEKAIGFILDSTPPETKISVAAPNYSYGDMVYATADSGLTLSATDVGSGAKAIEYRIDGGVWATYDSAFRVSAEGGHVVEYRSVDNVGNVEALKTLEIFIDSTAPQTEITMGHPVFATGDGVMYVGVNTLFELSSGDAASGVAATWYRIDEGEWLGYAPFVLENEGSHTIRFMSADNVGNTEGEKTLEVIVDNTPPEVSVKVGSPSSEAEALYVAGQTLFALQVSDALSGTAYVEFRVDGAEWSTYHQPFSISGEGSHGIEFMAVDNIGNASIIKTLTVVVDNTSPMTSIGVGSPQYQGETALYVAGSTVFTLSAVDALSGVVTIEYSLDGGPWNIYGPFTVPGEGSHTIAFRSMDKVGNVEGEKTLAVAVDNTPPTTEMTVGEPKFSTGGNLYVSGGTSFTLVASDQLSGVSGTEYRVDGGQWLSYEPFTVASEGGHLIEFRSTDKVGNQEEVKALSIIVDSTPPNTGINIGDPKYISSSGVVFATKDTDLILSASDSLSGVSRTEYRIDGGGWTLYAPFRIDAEGAHEVTYRSLDNLGNPEESKTFAIVIDNTPPVTNSSIGEPMYISTSGDIYATEDSVFTLLASDGLSGVAVTEYKVDGGAWALYSPFGMAAEGSHTIEYRSKDNVGNVEGAKTISVIVDNTPPPTIINVGTPQYKEEGNFYIGGNTEISLSATDSASGLLKVEYGIDGGGFIAYTGAITLASHSDGIHSLTYHSIDNLGNVEDAKNLTVVLDKTPPHTAISASDPLAEEVVNTVSPRTKFTLSAEDNLSGVKGIRYSVDGGAWNTYVANFSLSGLDAGLHTIAYKATDNVLNEEEGNLITVRLILIETTKGVSEELALLVGVWGDNSDIELKQIDMTILDAILSSLGVNYYIPPTMDDFIAALRSGRYNTYLLMDVKEPLVGEEIREAVNYGDGLIFIKTSPQADPFMDDVFGVKFTGKTTSSDLAVDLVESPISGEDTIQSVSKNVVATITSDTAEGYAYVMDKHNTYPSIVFNQYGRGRSVLYNFDLFYGTDLTKATSLIANSLSLIKPQEHYPRALDRVPVRIGLVDLAEPIEVRVTETLPYGTTADTITPQATVTGSKIEWQKSLNAGETAMFGYYFNLPDSAGAYTAITELSYMNNGEYRFYNSYLLTLDVRGSSTGLLAEIISGLETIGAVDGSDSDNIGNAIEALAAINISTLDESEAEQNLRLVVKATDEIRRLSFDAAEIRLKLDELLKVLEKKWYLIIEKTTVIGRGE